MTTVTIHEAKTHLSRLIQRVLAGEEITVARGREPVIKLIPFEPVKPKRRELGWLAHESPDGRDIIGPAFWEPLSDAEMGLADHDDDPLSPTYRR
jgi:prevent-host-death family protein